MSLASWCSLVTTTWATTSATATAQGTEQPQCKQHHHHHQPPPFWGLSTLPSVPKQSKNFIDECESLMSFLGRFRGGSSNSDFGYKSNDDPRRRQPSYKNNQGSSRYDEYYQDDDDDYNYGGGGNTNVQGGDYDYDDRSSGAPQRQRPPLSSASSFVDSLPSIFKTGDCRIGLTLVGAGSVISMLGISLFLNKALLRLGNLLFITSVVVTMGLSRTAAFFLKPKNLRATVCLGIGIVLVVIGSPVFRMILEVFGLLNLFGNMFPVIMAVAKTMPGIGPILTNAKEKTGAAGSRRNDPYYDKNEDDRDYYNNDDNYYDDQQSSRKAGGYDKDERYDGGYY